MNFKKTVKPMAKTPPKKALFLIGGAVLLALMSFGFYRANTLNQQKAQQAVIAPVLETTPVVVAAKALPAGSILTKTDLQTVDWPKSAVPTTSSQTGALASSAESLEGRILKRDLYPGEPVYMAKLAGDKSLGGLTALIPAGMRAVTIEVSDIKGVAGFIKPGDRVDVLSKVEMSHEGDSVTLTKTVLQNVLVLASEQTMVDDRVETVNETVSVEGKSTPGADPETKKPASFGADKKKAKPATNVTLAVWPQEAEILTLSEEMGSLRLSLRGEEDYRRYALKGQTGEEVFQSTALKGYQAEAQLSRMLPKQDGSAPAASAGKMAVLHGQAGGGVQTSVTGQVVEVYNGTERQDVQF